MVAFKVQLFNDRNNLRSYCKNDDIRFMSSHFFSFSFDFHPIHQVQFIARLSVCFTKIASVSLFIILLFFFLFSCA